METEVISKPHKLKFDVFRSFRGEDTRHNFTERVYGALHRKEKVCSFTTTKVCNEVMRSILDPSPAIEDSAASSSFYPLATLTLTGALTN
uniref:TIR domain-containing protein n=1 Tax=Brassica oleracea var. oleracea TaxID=109376 RepID=A0A0D3CDC3_BRAOL